MHNYFIPCQRPTRWDIHADIILNDFELAFYQSFVQDVDTTFVKVLSTSKSKPKKNFGSDMAKQSLNNTSTIDEGNLRGLLNFGGNRIAAHHGKVGYDTIEYTTVFLHSDWLYFLWHGINNDMFLISCICCEM